MDWLAGLKKAVDFMEEHLLDNISADDIAKECAISSFYLQKGFAIITGYSMGEYMRNRRLYKAAMEVYEFATSEWVKFECTMRTLQDVNTQIFNEWLPLNTDFEIAYSANIEWHDPNSEPGPDMNCEIWIPVKRK